MIKLFFGNDFDALKLLKLAGYQEVKNGVLRKPSSTHRVTERERRAIDYLIEEWDFEGLESS